MAELDVTATGTAGTPSSSAITSPGNPLATMTELIVTGLWSAGHISLQQQNPKDSSWSNVWGSLKNGHAIIVTPRLSTNYRWVTQGIVGTVNGYFGESLI
jgi:hypothetical protein